LRLNYVSLEAVLSLKPLAGVSHLDAQKQLKLSDHR